jgi:fused signal recognition particle receptor
MSNTFTKWKNGLSKSSKAAFGQIATLFGATEITIDTWDDIEATLIQADMGLETTELIVQSLEQRVDGQGLVKVKDLEMCLRDELLSQLNNPPNIVFSTTPSVILIVGVNGSGKTTTIAKLGHYYKQIGRSVLFGAADTYRAAAVDQLQIWADRLEIPIVYGQPGADAGAVAFDAVTSGMSRPVDIVIIDTAGRLHTRFNLMEELKKVYKVIGKAQEGAPHQVWLVLDATTGQNALQQAKAFKQAVNVTGVVLAKLDSSAKGGMAFSIQRELDLPIMVAGLGEKLDDLQPFRPDDFVDGILAEFLN